jgi:hypothetical protein
VSPLREKAFRFRPSRDSNLFTNAQRAELLEILCSGSIASKGVCIHRSLAFPQLRCVFSRHYCQIDKRLSHIVVCTDLNTVQVIGCNIGFNVQGLHIRDTVDTSHHAQYWCASQIKMTNERQRRSEDAVNLVCHNGVFTQRWLVQSSRTIRTIRMNELIDRSAIQSTCCA